MNNLTVMGGGDIVVNRYFSALDNEKLRNDLNINNVIDVKTKSEIFSKLKQKNISKLNFYQLHDTNPKTLKSFFKDNGLTNQPIIIATPTKYHVPYALELLKLGLHVAIEKPYAINTIDIENFDYYINKNGFRNIFFFGYYLIEKGLPLLAFGKAEKIHPHYFSYLTPLVDIHQLKQIRDILGEVKNIYGVLLEGVGSAGSLQHRSWVLDPASGGNTLDAFYHLVCLIYPFINSSIPIAIEEVHLAIHKKTLEWYKSVYGSQPAETLTSAEIHINENCNVNLICGKYVSSETHQRWISIEFENGWLYADLEAQEAFINTDEYRFRLGLKYKEKYVTQFCLLRDYLSDQKNPVEYKILRDALKVTLELREFGLKNPMDEYMESDINLHYLEKIFKQRISRLKH